MAEFNKFPYRDLSSRDSRDRWAEDTAEKIQDFLEEEYGNLTARTPKAVLEQILEALR